MISIRSNFFYTRTVPCELWFFDKGKPIDRRDDVLMIDARNIYRKVTRKIYDFSPEQLKNISSIVWLYRGEHDRFLALVAEHLEKTLIEARGCFEMKDEEGVLLHPLPDFMARLRDFSGKVQPFLAAQPQDGAHGETWAEFQEKSGVFAQDLETYRKAVEEQSGKWGGVGKTNKALLQAAEDLLPLAEQSRDLVKDADHLYKVAVRLIDLCEKALEVTESNAWNSREVNKARKALEEARKLAVEQLKQVRYFYRHARWLQERFPDGVLRDVPGLVKVVSRKEIEKNDWSLTPGRYVGVAPEEVDEDFDFEQAMRDIHIEIQDLNAEAVELAARIARNFEELGI